jgi:hypothetical protein
MRHFDVYFFMDINNNIVIIASTEYEIAEKVVKKYLKTEIKISEKLIYTSFLASEKEINIGYAIVKIIKS